MTDVVPSGLTYVSSTPSGATTYNSATGLWTIGALANAASATLVINATVNAGLGNNTITNTTSGLAADQFDPVSANNVGSVSLRVTRSDLSLTKTVNNATPSFGQSVTFTITLSNAGPDGATGVAVKDLLPAGLGFSSYTATVGSYVSGTGIWTVGSLANGGSATLQITATVNAYGSITNTAQVSATDQSDPDSTPNNNISTEDDQASASVGATPPSIALCKTIVGQPCPPPASLPTQSPGTDINYILTFTNSGGSPASSLVITDPYIDPALPVAARLKINDHTYFKVGSIVNTLPAGLSIVSVKYSNDSGVTWTYTPVSGGGSAPAGYDANVTHIQWTFGGSLSQNALSNSGNVNFVVRIK
jgi:large repetitive protein